MTTPRRKVRKVPQFRYKCVERIENEFTYFQNVKLRLENEMSIARSHDKRKRIYPKNYLRNRMKERKRRRLKTIKCLKNVKNRKKSVRKKLTKYLDVIMKEEQEKKKKNEKKDDIIITSTKKDESCEKIFCQSLKSSLTRVVKGGRRRSFKRSPRLRKVKFGVRRKSAPVLTTMQRNQFRKGGIGGKMNILFPYPRTMVKMSQFQRRTVLERSIFEKYIIEKKRLKLRKIQTKIEKKDVEGLNKNIYGRNPVRMTESGEFSGKNEPLFRNRMIIKPIVRNIQKRRKRKKRKEKLYSNRCSFKELVFKIENPRKNKSFGRFFN